MGLITLLLVVAYTALYLGRSLDKKPEQLVRVVDKIMPYVDQGALYAAAWGLFAALLTILMHYSFGGMLIRLASNVMICAMALPFAFSGLVEKYSGKVNVAVVDEAKNLVGWITKNEKCVGYAGAVCSMLLFFMLFK